MYSVMLVEDESAVRDGICKKINWNEHGFELAGAYENGRLAADALEKGPVDVVITDVNMPVMDGLALARLISETAPQTIVVILTGFGDFSYAQTAIRYRVHEYILKPITAKQLRELLDKLCGELDGRRAKERGVDLSELRRNVLRGIKLLNKSSALENLDSLIEKLAVRSLPQNEILAQLQKLMLLLSDYAEEEKLEVSSPGYSDGDMLEQLAKKTTVAAMREFLRGYVRALIEAGLGRSDNAASQAILAVDYIKENYGDPKLSLQKVTAYLSVSTSYFSNMFKNHTGVTFIDFLTRLRVNKARELLVTTDMKNYEIADRVGYDDPAYFSSTFKKLTGMKPSDYRREFKQDGGRRLEEE